VFFAEPDLGAPPGDAVKSKFSLSPASWAAGFGGGNPSPLTPIISTRPDEIGLVGSVPYKELVGPQALECSHTANVVEAIWV
jgi:hypothetical protein